MKFLILLFGMLLAVCLLYKKTFDPQVKLAQREQLLATVTTTSYVVQPQAINVI
ncbi:hypothetical protein ACSX1A_16095 [Pontibacter sp. MBLB2868]|uniref:hypothetical protein n=1 Tax=Pontibacter sp. MBLB2868 TaxID=3451555 RepID=UPI003F74FA1A